MTHLSYIILIDSHELNKIDIEPIEKQMIHFVNATCKSISSRIALDQVVIG